MGATNQAKMPDACVVFGCNNTPNKQECIGLHPIPFYGADDPQKRERRKKWVDFVQLKRAHWKPTKYSAICSKHFRNDDFTVMFSGLTGQTLQRRLRKDGLGICVFPTIHASSVEDQKSSESERSKRKVRKFVISFISFETCFFHSRVSSKIFGSPVPDKVYSFFKSIVP